MTSQGLIGTDTVSTPALLLEEDQENTVTHLVVHPLVLLHVLDHHTRRNEASGRVIGTLLGRRDGNKVSNSATFAEYTTGIQYIQFFLDEIFSETTGEMPDKGIFFLDL